MPDRSFDVTMYRFVLFSLLTGLAATLIRFVFTLYFGSAEVLRYGGTPVGMIVQSSLALVLWRRPQSLYVVLKIIYWYLALGISMKLTYLLFWDEQALYTNLLWMVPWMSVGFVLSFLIFSRPLATGLSVVVFGIWVTISTVFVVLNFGNPQGRAGLLMLPQAYLAQCVLIVFLVLYSKLRGLYLVSRKSVLQMEQIANTDFLLGIANRRSTQVEINVQMNQAVEMKTALSVILMDIDQFKEINDWYGHDTGDAVLVEITSLVLDVVKPPCLFGRWGGDEFLLVAPSFTALESCKLADKIRGTLAVHPFQIGQVTASFGVAEFRIGENMGTLLKRVDEALYESKKSGRNRVEIAI